MRIRIGFIFTIRVVLFSLLFTLVSINTGNAAVLPPSKAAINMKCNREGVSALTTKGAVVCLNEKWTTLTSANETVQSKAFSSILKRWNSQSAAKLNLTVYADPRAGSWTKDIKKGMEAGARFWGTSDETAPAIPVLISDNYKFIEETLLKLGIEQNEDDKKRNARTVGGQAGFHGAWNGDDAYWDYLFTNSESRFGAGYWQVPAHEYTHFAQSKLSNGRYQGEFSPPWLDEGIPSYIGAVLGPMSNMPHDIMNYWRNDLKSTQVNLSYFEKNIESVHQSNRWSDVYPLGAVACEALVALVGIESIFTYYMDLSKEMDHESSMRKNFKMTSKDLNALLAGYVRSVKEGKEWNLKQLINRYKAISIKV